MLRNVGGRVTPATLRTLAMLTKVSQANQDSIPAGVWNLVILHHTDCGMTDLAAFPDLLAEYFEIPADELGAKSVSDPVGSVRADVEVILAKTRRPAAVVSGLVYDVSTGLVETVVVPTPLRTGRRRRSNLRRVAEGDAEQGAGGYVVISLSRGATWMLPLQTVQVPPSAVAPARPCRL